MYLENTILHVVTSLLHHDMYIVYNIILKMHEHEKTVRQQLYAITKLPKPCHTHCHCMYISPTTIMTICSEKSGHLMILIKIFFFPIHFTITCAQCVHIKFIEKFQSIPRMIVTRLMDVLIPNVLP